MSFVSPIYQQPGVQPFYIAHPALLTTQSFGDSTRTAQLTYLHDVFIPVPVILVGFSVAHGTVSAGNVDLGIYDVNGNLITHTGVTAVTGPNTEQIITLAKSVTLSPGVYYMALWPDNATDTYFARTGLNPQGAWSDVRSSNATNAGGLLSTFAAMTGTAKIATFVPFMGLIQGGYSG